MLGLYLNTLIIGHTSCNRSILLNKLTLQKKLQNFVKHNVFCDKTIKNTTTTTKQKITQGFRQKTIPDRREIDKLIEFTQRWEFRQNGCL